MEVWGEGLQCQSCLVLPLLGAVGKKFSLARVRFLGQPQSLETVARSSHGSDRFHLGRQMQT